MKKALLLPVIILLFASCNLINRESVRGDGNVVSNVREVAAFKSIRVQSAIEVVLTQAAEHSVKVETDANLQEYIEVDVRGDELLIKTRNNTSISGSHRTVVHVTAPVVNALQISGASVVTTTNRLETTSPFYVGLSGACEATVDVKAPSVKIDVSGASSVKIKGETKDVRIDASGSSGVKAMELLAENSTVDISGASHAHTYASVQLDAKASGASEVKYKGDAKVNSNSSGASSINKEE